MSMSHVDASDIAVIGLAGRFPGARDVGEFWTMLREGREAIAFFSAEELLAEGIPAEVVRDPHYVPAKGVLDDPDMFDAAFFGYSPREAAAIDPQQRMFLECASDALENAGIDPETSKAAIGVYAGSSAPTYLTRAIRELGNLPEFLEIIIGNDKDHLATRTSYKLGLKGPGISVQSACSTSLVAAHLAGQGLLGGDCDIALAGGVSVMFPRREGYLFSAEGIYSHDGHCRAFDARANGTVPGDGVGLVVLKLLSAALEDGDTVHAVIKGSAINNDGAAKVGYSAPSIAGQTGVIRAAHRVAGVDPATIGYVETHGTATALGDPAEVTALTRAFRAGTDRVGFCGIGSVKSNIGHLDAAAGIAGLIKTILALEHGIMPPSLYFETPNPAMKIESSPFFVNATARPWPAGGTPRRAGVSSFGIGGTNAHVVLQEAPTAEPSIVEPPAVETSGPEAPEPGPHLLVLSARTASALDAMTANLATHLRGNPDLDLADVAHTTQVGRRTFEYRRFLICRDTADAVRGLTGEGSRRPPSTRRPAVAPPVAFLLPGQGAQYGGMGAELYQAEPRFREVVDHCCDHLIAELGVDLRDVMFSHADAEVLDDTALAQPALFVVEYALAQLWQAWGVRPRALIGHSVGEYVAACLAGVFALPDALMLMACRGRLMRQAPAGAMLSVQLPEPALGTLPAGLSIAAVNAPDLCVVSGPEPDVAALERKLSAGGVGTRRLHTSRAFHSTMMSTAAAELRSVVAGVPRHPPVIPFVSNVTGDWITDEQATDPGYWAEHTLVPVRFAAGLATLLRAGDHALLEVGPGRTLTTLARQQAADGTVVVGSMRHPRSSVPDVVALAEAVGSLWSVGTPIDWRQRHAHQRRRRVPLPTYPFERQRYWLSELAGAPGRPPVPTTRPPVPAPDEGPQNEVQRAVAAIWTELLGVPAVAPDDDFFQLGGHSLLGTRLTTRLRELFGVEIKVRDLFDAPTMGDQADLVAALRHAAQGRPARSDGYEEGEV